MYEWSRLTPSERGELLHQRRLKQLPLHAPPHDRSATGCCLVTAATYGHAPLFAPVDRLERLAASLRDTFAPPDSALVAWVALPNHYHVLCELGDATRLPSALALLHGRLSHWINGLDRQRGRRVWYRYTDRSIRGEEHYFATIRYLHANPVKHGLVERGEDWPWSSWHEYACEERRRGILERADQYAIDRYGVGWDDF